MRSRSLLWRGRVHIRRLLSQRLLAFGFNKLFYCLKRRRLFELFAIPSDRCAAVGSYGDAVIRVFFCSSATADTRFPIQEEEFGPLSHVLRYTAPQALALIHTGFGFVVIVFVALFSPHNYNQRSVRNFLHRLPSCQLAEQRSFTLAVACANINQSLWRQRRDCTLKPAPLSGPFVSSRHLIVLSSRGANITISSIGVLM